MNMSIWRASCTESRVSYPSPCAMALATTPKRCRNLYTKQNESSPCCTSEPTRKSPGVMVLWSVSVSTGACALHAWSLPYSKSALALLLLCHPSLAHKAPFVVLGLAPRGVHEEALGASLGLLHLGDAQRREQARRGGHLERLVDALHGVR